MMEKIIDKPMAKMANSNMNSATNSNQGRTKDPSKAKATTRTPISNNQVKKVALASDIGRTMRGKYTF